MIMLTKLDGTLLLLNFDNVKYIEAIPDTLVAFVNGDSVIVKETLDEIAKKAIVAQGLVMRAAQSGSGGPSS